jgi:nucleotide-binding universal stress UspA family protein
MSFASGLKTIVVATDLDGRADAALEYARKLAVAYGARIVLAHGLDPMDYASVAAVPGKVLRSLTEDARAALDEMSAQLVREGIHSHSEIRQGEVAQMLVDVARQYEAGLIVIGTEGKQGAGPIVVGAVAEQLVRLAPCAVLAVAADYNAGSYRPVPGGPIMLAMERNDATAEASETASSLAEIFHRTLIVVHARRPEEAVAFLNPVATTAEQFGLENSPRFPLRCIVKDGKPGDAIVEAIGQYQPSVLVVGVKRTSGTPGPHGTAFTLLARSRVPVLCVPPSAVVSVARESEVLTSVPH